MKKGLTLVELAQAIERSEQEKKDYIASTSKLWATAEEDGFEPESGGLEVEVSGVGRFRPNEVAHEQLGSKLDIPKRYYDRMLREEPRLLATNLNCWLRKSPENRMVRTQGNTMRAFLSDRYRPMDNFMVLHAALPVLREQEGIEVKSTALTERRMYIQAVTPKLFGEPKVGDVIRAGIVISNSEVGCGAVRVEPLLYRLACANGMIRSISMKKYHLGKRIDSEGDLSFYQAETIEADNRAFLLKVRDTVAEAFNQISFDKEILRLQATTENKITGKLDGTVTEVTKKFGFSDGEKDDILKALIEGADLSQYGLANAVTRVANDVEKYDRAIDLERIGGQIIDLSQSEWTAVAG